MVSRGAIGTVPGGKGKEVMTTPTSGVRHYVRVEVRGRPQTSQGPGGVTCPVGNTALSSSSD